MVSQETRTNENISKAAPHQPFGRNCISLFAPNPKFNLQPKLSVNQSNDVYENEAGMVANNVMRMTSPVIQTKPFSDSSLQRKCAHCEKEENKMQRKEFNAHMETLDSDLESYVGNLNSRGQSLSEDVRSFYEPRFGCDFSNVKVHTDAVAAKSAKSINALAYTSGNNIVFNDGQYAPGTDTGKTLLAHELTHVVQQNSSSIQQKAIQRQEIDTGENASSGAIPTGDCSGYRSDPESLSWSAARHYVRTQLGLDITPGNLKCSGRSCMVFFSNNIKIQVDLGGDIDVCPFGGEISVQQISPLPGRNCCYSIDCPGDGSINFSGCQ